MNLGNHEYMLRQLLRRLDQGGVGVRIEDTRLVCEVRRRRPRQGKAAREA